MSILVVCTGCKKSFQVADKFAGKSGPCPKCKTVIKVPEKGQEVKVHGAEEFGTGGRSIKGELLTKPVARKQLKLRPAVMASIGGGAVGVLLMAWLGGRLGLLNNAVGAGFGLMLISPVLVIAAYSFLYDDELEPYRGRLLYLRTAACAAAYLLLWAIFAYVRGVVQPEDLPQWAFIAPPFIVVGGVAAWLSLDIEPGSGFLHYAFYLLVTIVLGWVAGLGWVWDVPKPGM